jgi:putative protease
VARTAQVYRQAIDDAVAGRPFNPALLADLEGLANRGYTDGFYQRHHTHEYQNYMDGHSKAKRSQFVGEIVRIEDGWARIEVKNKFSLGDTLEVIHPSGNINVQVQAMRDKRGNAIEVAPGNGIQVQIPLAAQYDKALLARLF